MILSERQRTAESLAREINRMGAWVINPMPLDANAKPRFQVLDDNREKVLEKLAGWDWSPSLCGTFPRICFDGMKPGQRVRDRSASRAPTRSGRPHPWGKSLSGIPRWKRTYWQCSKRAELRNEARKEAFSQ
jgi:hypothetical protein